MSWGILCSHDGCRGYAMVAVDPLDSVVSIQKPAESTEYFCEKHGRPLLNKRAMTPEEKNRHA